MRRWMSALALMLAIAGGAGAQVLEFIEPSQTTVRGDVKIQVDLGPAYRNGSVAFYLGEAGQTLEFNSATIANDEGLFGVDWQTQGAESRVPDGEYRILAIGYNAAGEVIGQKSMTVQVQNDVPDTQIPTAGILLRYNLTPGRTAGYRGLSLIAVQGGEGLGDDAFKEVKVQGFGGAVAGRWAQRVLWRNPDGKAQVRNSVYYHFEGRPLLDGRQMPAHGHFLSFLQEPDGDTIRREDLTPVEFPFAELAIEFPEEPVKVGDQWRSVIRIMVDPRSNYVDELVATHTLTGVQWYGGARCAVIKSEFSGGPYRVSMAGVKQSESATGGPGGAPSGPMSSMGAGGPGGGTGAPGPPEPQTYGVTVLLRGERTTFFAFQPEVGRVLKAEETMEQLCALESDGSGAGGMGGAGPMGPEMMGPPGMIGGPAGEMPSMPGAGMPGMMPGMMPPGAPGMPTMPGMEGGRAGGPPIAGGAPMAGSGMMPMMPGVQPGMMPPGGTSAGMGGMSGMGMMPGAMGMGGGDAGAQQKTEIKVAHFTRAIRTTITLDAALRRDLRNLLVD